jgi:hypothetical protein
MNSFFKLFLSKDFEFSKVLVIFQGLRSIGLDLLRLGFSAVEEK